jgi:hypothetical protein
MQNVKLRVAGALKVGRVTKQNIAGIIYDRKAQRSSSRRERAYDVGKREV